MKKKVIIMGAAAALVLCAIVGGTVAAPTAKSEKATTTINIEDLDVALASTFDADSESENLKNVKLENLVPGAVVDFNYTVKNTNASGYDLYTRVVIDKKWMNGNRVDTSLNPEYLHILVGEEDADVSSNSLSSDWIIASIDSEQVVLFYRKVLEPGVETEAFLKSLKLDTDMDNKYVDKTAELSITVSAVQADFAEKSMLAEWGVMPVFEEDGKTLKEIRR